MLQQLKQSANICLKMGSYTKYHKNIIYNKVFNFYVWIKFKNIFNIPIETTFIYIHDIYSNISNSMRSPVVKRHRKSLKP